MPRARREPVARQGAQRRPGRGGPGTPPRRGRPSVPVTPGGSSRGGTRHKGGMGLETATRAMWGGLGLLLAALIAVAIVAKTPASSSPSGPSFAASLTKPVDGIACTAATSGPYRAYVHLALYLRGHAVPLPAGIGVFGPHGTQPACAYALRTRDNSGVIHIVAPRRVTYTLGQFFDIWGMPLGPRVLMGFQATSGRGGMAVSAYVDGKRYLGNPRDIPLSPNAAIVLEYGPPWVRPAATYPFPHGE
jgi:hypothetical protein